jgi:hypothetical protein
MPPWASPVHQHHSKHGMLEPPPNADGSPSTEQASVDSPCLNILGQTGNAPVFGVLPRQSPRAPSHHHPFPCHWQPLASCPCTAQHDPWLLHQSSTTATSTAPRRKTLAPCSPLFNKRVSALSMDRQTLLWPSPLPGTVKHAPCKISMPGCIERALQRFQRFQHAPPRALTPRQIVALRGHQPVGNNCSETADVAQKVGIGDLKHESHETFPSLLLVR